MKLTVGKITVMAAMLAMVAFNAAAETRSEIKRMVVEEAMNSRVPPALALAVAKVESDFQQKALSTAGARGVMQIMPATAQSEFGIDADELWTPRLNVQLGIDYLERLYDQYGGKWELALSHYNGGTLSGKGANAVPHVYTRKYVKSVLNWYHRYTDQARVWRVTTHDEAPSWTPSRTRVTEKPNPPRIVVQESPATAIVRWYPAKRRAAPGKLDDFTDVYVRGRFPTGGKLDDFSRRVTWRDS